MSSHEEISLEEEGAGFPTPTFELGIPRNRTETTVEGLTWDQNPVSVQLVSQANQPMLRSSRLDLTESAQSDRPRERREMSLKERFKLLMSQVETLTGKVGCLAEGLNAGMASITSSNQTMTKKLDDSEKRIHQRLDASDKKISESHNDIFDKIKAVSKEITIHLNKHIDDKTAEINRRISEKYLELT